MSGPVDVRAELDALIIIRAARAAKAGAPLTAVGDLKRAESTRAAVDELIEAANRARSILALHDDRCPQLEAALANVGGAK